MTIWAIHHKIFSLAPKFEKNTLYKCINVNALCIQGYEFRGSTGSGPNNHLSLSQANLLWTQVGTFCQVLFKPQSPIKWFGGTRTKKSTSKPKSPEVVSSSLLSILGRPYLTACCPWPVIDWDDTVNKLLRFTKKGGLALDPGTPSQSSGRDVMPFEIRRP